MRLQWLWLFAASTLLVSIFVPWGEKHIDDHHCTTTWDQASLQGGQRCTSDEWHVGYRPFSLETRHTAHSFVGSNATGEDWAYRYTDAEAPHQPGIGPLLEHGGAALILGVAAMTISGIVHQLQRTVRTRLVARIGWSLYFASVLSFILGMAYHAGTWSAEEIDHLAPGMGLLYAAIPLLAGVPLLPERQPDLGLPALPSLD